MGPYSSLSLVAWSSLNDWGKEKESLLRSSHVVQWIRGQGKMMKKEFEIIFLFSTPCISERKYSPLNCLTPCIIKQYVVYGAAWWRHTVCPRIWIPFVDMLYTNVFLNLLYELWIEILGVQFKIPMNERAFLVLHSYVRGVFKKRWLQFFFMLVHMSLNCFWHI